MSLRVAVDFGTSSTCVAVSVRGREPQVVVVDGQPIVPSAVFAAADGTLFVGQEAERQAAVDPARYEPHPKRRVDESELLLGTTVLPVADAVRAVLARAVDEARRFAGGAPVDQLVLTHPAAWGAVRTGVLLRAAHGLGREVRLVPEPVAAAVFHSASHAVPDGAALAVLDLGGGTVDASVVVRRAGSFQVLASEGDPGFGGADIDQALLEHIGGSLAEADRAAWAQLVEGRELADRRKRRVLRQDVRGAKETLSRHSYTDVPLPPPLPDAHVTRLDLERLVAEPLARAAALVASTARAAGLEPGALAAVFLVGGTSRVPLVARLVLEQTGAVPTSIDQPETVVARGALLAAAGPGEQPRAGGPSGTEGPTTRITPPDDGATHKITPADGRTRKITRRMTAPPLPGPVQSSPVQPGPPQPGPPQSGPFAQPQLPPPLPPPRLTRFPSTMPPQPRPRPGPPARRSRVPLVVGGVLALVLVVGAATAYALTGGWWSGSGPSPAPTTSAPPADERVTAQYDYRFSRPEGWEQSGSDAQERRVQLKPSGATGDGAVLVVQERRLNYDATAEPGRAQAELRAQYEAGGAGLSDFDAGASFAGKDVVHFREAGQGASTDWYVVFQERVQVSVGCRYADQDRERVRSACEHVVRTLSVTS
ncbi:MULTISPECIES: type VII secretion-associated protein [Actinosynnema]|uniref:type VII secretion-associated protein n=1 Tax=Actinosynnema TaxID=40566 RepID=UPI0020A30A58|nr:type VII secretion-associated protein [Actinosynnema pretiosum]MCP2095290.1 type VII secretion-associated protein, Rv3446c family, C-terminal domain-containing protein [Actinosynnema pretiosum]